MWKIVSPVTGRSTVTPLFVNDDESFGVCHAVPRIINKKKKIPSSRSASCRLYSTIYYVRDPTIGESRAFLLLFLKFYLFSSFASIYFSGLFFHVLPVHHTVHQGRTKEVKDAHPKSIFLLTREKRKTTNSSTFCIQTYIPPPLSTQQEKKSVSKTWLRVTWILRSKSDGLEIPSWHLFRVQFFFFL